MVAVRRPDGLVDDLTRLASALESIDLRGADVLGQDTGSVRDRVVSTIRSYLVPRIEDPQAPFLVVVAGPTGSGKSTLINSLAGLDLAATGALRPTTTAPLVLTGGERSTRDDVIGGVECHVVTGRAPILEHMSLVDTPDIDSTATHHRVMAEAMIDQADVVVFVTSALRYSDDVPWKVLRRARSRGAVIIPVLNRVGADSGAAVHDFGRRLGDAGLDEEVVRVPEHHLGPRAAQIPSLAVRELRRRLFWVARDRGRHQAGVVNRVINSTADQIRQLMSTVTGLAAQLDEIETEMTAGILDAATVVARNRPWAAFPLPTVPQKRVRRWMRSSQPTTAEFEVWQQSVRAGLVAELETNLRSALTAHTAQVRALKTDAVNAIAVDTRPMFGDAVDGWLKAVGRASEGSRYPRLRSAIAISSVLTPTDPGVVDTVLGSSDAIAEQRAQLEARVAVVFGHVADRLSELWRISVGDPAVDDLGARLAAVVAAYQFADA